MSAGIHFNIGSIPIGAGSDGGGYIFFSMLCQIFNYVTGICPQCHHKATVFATHIRTAVVRGERICSHL